MTEDVGRKINPMIIEGQMAGGLAQGIGGAMLEEFVYSEDGQPLSTNFMDYLLPTAMEVPKAQLISTEDFPSPHNPLGVKGAGEGGITAAGAALANAVSNALGVEVKKLPFKPDYVLQLIKEREATDELILGVIPMTVQQIIDVHAHVYPRAVSPKCSRPIRIQAHRQSARPIAALPRQPCHVDARGTGQFAKAIRIDG